MLRNIKNKITSRIPDVNCKNTQEINDLIENCMSSKAEFETNVNIYLKKTQPQDNRDIKTDEELSTSNIKN